MYGIGQGTDLTSMSTSNGMTVLVNRYPQQQENQKASIDLNWYNGATSTANVTFFDPATQNDPIYNATSGARIAYETSKQASTFSLTSAVPAVVAANAKGAFVLVNTEISQKIYYYANGDTSYSKKWIVIPGLINRQVPLGGFSLLQIKDANTVYMIIQLHADEIGAFDEYHGIAVNSNAATQAGFVFLAVSMGDAPQIESLIPLRDVSLASIASMTIVGDTNVLIAGTSTDKHVLLYSLNVASKSFDLVNSTTPIAGTATSLTSSASLAFVGGADGVLAIYDLTNKRSVAYNVKTTILQMQAIADTTLYVNTVNSTASLGVFHLDCLVEPAQGLPKWVLPVILISVVVLGGCFVVFLLFGLCKMFIMRAREGKYDSI